MSRNITIAGNTYTVPEIDFNAVCDLADVGIDIMQMKAIAKRPLPAARSLAAWIMDTDIETAGAEIQKHILGGGSLEELFNAFTAELEDSNFFKSLQGGKVTPRDHLKKAK